MKCWSCHAEREGQPWCPACGKVGPLTPGATHFDVMGVPRSVDVNATLLDARFRERSLRVHPDRVVGSEAKERRFALEQTTALNEAHRTLKEPGRRAFYLLKLHGVDLDREDTGGQRNVPMELLEEILERREALEAARSHGDLTAARRMADEVRSQRRATLEEALAKLKVLEAGEKIPAMLAGAVHALARVRYLDRFLEETDRMEEEAAS